MGQESPSRRTSLKYGSLENILQGALALNSCQNVYRNEPSWTFATMQGLQWTCAWPLGVAANVCIVRERACHSPSALPALVETNRPVFHIQDFWLFAKTWGELGVRVGCQGNCLGLEDECFHRFNRKGGRWAPGLAKYHILVKIV